jgi:hypothetical protein
MLKTGPAGYVRSYKFPRPNLALCRARTEPLRDPWCLRPSFNGRKDIQSALRIDSQARASVHHLACSVKPVASCLFDKEIKLQLRDV